MTEVKPGKVVKKGMPGSGDKIMTEQQFLALAKILKSDAKTPANEAARLVLVEGLTKPAAVEKTGVTRSSVHDATTRYFKAFQEIEKAWPNAVTVAMEMANVARKSNKATARKSAPKDAD